MSSAPRLQSLANAVSAALEGGCAYVLSRRLFLRLLGLTYLVAFASLWVQIEGLIGSRGVLPIANLLDAAGGQAGARRFWHFPTLCWLTSADWFLHAQCAAGAVLSALVVAGVAPMPSLALLWLLYLSLSTAGQDFLAFQWDVLLLETGFLAIFLAPRRWRPGPATETPPPLIAVWLLRWLLFRLMFMSGAVKLLSGDETWWTLAALDVHYETQPLPTWIGWHAHQLPAWFQRASVFVMFVIELVLPAFIFGGPKCRLAAAAGFTGLMILIALTGNYCFFNLLTGALCVLLLDDRRLARIAPKRLRRALAGSRGGRGEEAPVSGSETASPQSEVPSGVSAPATQRRGTRLGFAIRFAAPALFACFVLLVTGAQLLTRLRGQAPPPPVLSLLRLVSPLRTFNSYGLFADMTETRLEIVIEGSNDGVRWRPYKFKWKPGDLKRAPAFVEPHQPRLDWQMWFAALGDARHNPWFVNLMVRLLEGEPEVLALLDRNPFPGQPPRLVRAVRHEYRFTDRATRRATGEWWRREFKGLYCPPIALRER